MNSLSRHQKRRIDRCAFIAALAVALCLTIALDGCTAHTRETSTTPAAPVTTFQQVLVDNDILANTNLAVAKGIIAERDLGNIPAPVAHKALALQDRLARLDKRVSQILAKGPDGAKANSTSIASLLNEMAGLVQDPALNGVGSPEVKSNVALVAQKVSSILAGLHAAGVII